ncbi:MAG TPA: SCP2 sterol-binding domain-containing protein [Acidimicrobiales bacterium]|nr:SCP2 sterol-binding domain-containing protein [Acidimicrobiales bacterium]
MATVRFLSSEWIDEAATAARSSEGLAAATAGARLTVQQVVTGGPEGDIRYVVSIDDGEVGLRAGVDEAPDVTFSLEWDTAVAMATGVLGAQEAFTSGRLELQGDVGALLRHSSALADLDSVFAALRERTTY